MENLNVNDTLSPVTIKFSPDTQSMTIFQGIVFIVSFMENTAMFVKTLRQHRKRKFNRTNLFLLNLSIADLLVTCLIFPLELVWNTPVSESHGKILCPTTAFVRVFGPNLSAFIVVCITLDRYFAVLTPLGFPHARRRARITLLVAWISSVLFSLPQVLLIDVSPYSQLTSFQQCDSFNYYPTPEFKLLYTLSNFFVQYVFPLITIICCYSRIVYEICRSTAKEQHDRFLWKSSMDTFQRAKTKVSIMSIVIVISFLISWTPYHIMSFLHMAKNNSTILTDHPDLQVLLILTCTTSCANPLIYGLFNGCIRKNSSKVIRWRRPVIYNCIVEQKSCSRHKTRVSEKFSIPLDNQRGEHV